jgi:hypothetical protein
MTTAGLRTRRYVPDAVYAVAERLKSLGIEFRKSTGPWRPSLIALLRPGRNAERSIPIVTNGVVEIAVDTAEHAVDLSAFLNTAGVEHLDPIPNLRPPHQDVLRS